MLAPRLSPCGYEEHLHKNFFTQCSSEAFFIRDFCEVVIPLKYLGGLYTQKKETGVRFLFFCCNG